LVAPSAYQRRAARQHNPALLPERARRDASLLQASAEQAKKRAGPVEFSQH
jgi:hypothetical protein